MPTQNEETIPYSITSRQAIQQLIIDGIYDNVQPIIDSEPDIVKRKLMQAFLEKSGTFDRNHEQLIQFATALGLTSDALDQMFIKASRL